MGDQGLVAEFDNGALLVVVDGLGHGEKAAAAASIAIDVCDEYRDEPVEQLVQRCHTALRGTRGAAMSIASVNAPANTLTWLGIGNVGAITVPFTRDERLRHIHSTPGIVGYNLPALAPSSVDLHTGDLIVFATDGIAPDFPNALRPVGSARRIAERILTKHGKDTDDALVLVARYLGGGA